MAGFPEGRYELICLLGRCRANVRKPSGSSKALRLSVVNYDGGVYVLEHIDMLADDAPMTVPVPKRRIG